MSRLHRTGTFRAVLGLGISAVFVMGITAGCAAPEKLTRDNYSKVQIHASTEDDVRKALGEPDNILGTKWLYERPDRHLHVMIDFKDGKVARMQWVDAAAEVWHDTEDAKGPAKPK